MRIAVLGTGAVGRNLASKLLSLGHDVIMGTRDPEKTKADKEPNNLSGESFYDWYKNYQAIEIKQFSETAKEANLVINATGGKVSIDVLKLVGKNNLKGLILIDVANPLDFSKGFPPFLSVCNTESLAEQIQADFPETFVVKALNTMNTAVMTDPEMLGDEHNLFICGNDTNAKATVEALLITMGWKESQFIDLGDLSAARGMEMMLPLWIQLFKKYGHANFNWYIQMKD